MSTTVSLDPSRFPRGGPMARRGVTPHPFPPRPEIREPNVKFGAFGPKHI